MEILKDRYTITELSERLNVTDHALRYYEKEFNLCVPKDERGRRYYTTELANIMFQIKNMRDEGLEIKAIKKIFMSENIIKDPPPVVMENDHCEIIASAGNATSLQIQHFFEEFRDQITSSVSTEVGSAKEQLSTEIYKTKLELGACVENGMRKLESKMDKHFEQVDRSIVMWREKNKKSSLKRIVDKLFK